MLSLLALASAPHFTIPSALGNIALRVRVSQHASALLHYADESEREDALRAFARSGELSVEMRVMGCTWVTYLVAFDELTALRAAAVIS